jgi:hypothetical protein
MSFFNKYMRATVLLVCIGMLVSCKKYLDVRPKTEAPQNILFNSQQGFKDALTGVYIQMRGGSTYGSALSFGTIDRLISNWDVTANTTDQRIGLYLFQDEGVQGAFRTIYNQLYYSIANLNALLAKIDQQKNVFTTTGLYEIVKGEALALRAYLHLDILRLYGPIPEAIDPAIKLSYVTKLSSETHPVQDFNTYKNLLFADLTEAERLLKDVDPVLKYTITELSNPAPTAVFNPEDTYMAYRHLRLNYFAIKALQARTHLWFNEKEQAYAAAKEVVDAKNQNGSTKFRLGTAADMTASNYVLTPEHVFGLYDFDMANSFLNNFNSGNYKKGANNATINGQLYGSTGTDIREANLWQQITLANQSNAYILRKYRINTTGSTAITSVATDYRQIPLLRLSEMYLILCETAPAADVQTYWASFRQARNIPVTTLPVDPALKRIEVIKEYRKEFYGEGQAFYAYKRINAPKTNVLFTPAAATINYVVPVPVN